MILHDSCHDHFAVWVCAKFQCHDPEDSGPARRLTTSRSNSSEADRTKDVTNHEPRGLPQPGMVCSAASRLAEHRSNFS